MAQATEMMRVTLLAGKIMLESGAETYRVEETMTLMAKSQQMQGVNCLVLPTGIFLSFRAGESNERTRILRIRERTTDLNKITQVNDVSRRLVQGELSLEQAEQELLLIERQPMAYPTWLQHIAAGVAGGSFAILFGGILADFWPAFLAGFFVNLSLNLAEKILKVTFFAELCSAFVGGLFSYLLFRYGGLGYHLDPIIIGSLMPLVPGVTLTNGVRDIIAGDLISGLGRVAEGLITTLSIAIGVALAISIF